MECQEDSVKVKLLKKQLTSWTSTLPRSTQRSMQPKSPSLLPSMPSGHKLLQEPTTTSTWLTRKETNTQSRALFHCHTPTKNHKSTKSLKDMYLYDCSYCLWFIWTYQYKYSHIDIKIRLWEVSRLLLAISYFLLYLTAETE